MFDNLRIFNYQQYASLYVIYTLSMTTFMVQVTGNSAFWPLVVTGAPYYISGNRALFLIYIATTASTPNLISIIHKYYIISISINIFIYLHVHPSIYLFIHLSIHLFIHLSYIWNYRISRSISLFIRKSMW